MTESGQPITTNVDNPPPQSPPHAAMDEGSWSVFWRVIAENFRLNRSLYPLALLCLLIVAATSAVLAWLVKEVVNEVLLAKDTNMVFWVAGTLTSVYIIRGLANFIQKILMARIGNSIVATYQQKIYRHLLILDLAYFKGLRSGQLVGQINQNISTIRSLITTMISGMTRDLFTALGLLYVMLLLEPMLTFATMGVVVIGGGATQFLIKSMKRKAISQTNAISQVASRLQETVQNIDIVKAFTLEDRFEKSASVLIKDAEIKSNSAMKTEAASSPIMEALAGLSIGGMLVFVGLRATNGNVDPGSFFAFLTALIMLYDPIRRLINLRVIFEGVITNARMLEAMLETKPRQVDQPDAQFLEVHEGQIELTNVSFDYGDDLPVLNDISLTAKSGKMTAIVGMSGSGKSTIFNLLLRFYDAQNGTITIDSQDISAVTTQSLRNSIAYVSQSPILFEGSIADNIGYGRKDATREDIEAAAQAAFADVFIRNLPEGYDTLLGEQGVNLSGGQRQRLSIARAILRDARVLLLDEATSALDTESEAKVQQAIDALAGSRTVIVIAHRLSTISKADDIYVLDAGRVAEHGDHEGLLSKGGAYAQFYALQASGKQDTSETNIVAPDFGRGR